MMNTLLLERSREESTRFLMEAIAAAAAAAVESLRHESYYSLDESSDSNSIV